MRLWASEIAAIAGGELRGGDVEVTGARHDSREVSGGELFIPVRGDRDGHDFIGDAMARGAAAYLTRHAQLTDAGPAILVEDPEGALAALGRAARSRLSAEVVGVTGSVGKTSTKDLASAAFRSERKGTHASLRSFNNELGVPLTLLNAPEGTQVAIIEMGARGAGHIKELCEIARPTIAVVTAVELVHTENFGSIDQVAVAKRELVESVPASGTVVLNAANAHVAPMSAHTDAAVLTFGTPQADLWASGVTLDDQIRARFVLCTPWGRAPVRLQVRGHHNVTNALAAAGAALAGGVSIEGAAAGLERAELSPWRMQLVVAGSGARILNDAYNAGPASMAAALDSLSRIGGDRHTAVLGPMAELGEHEARAHERVAALAAGLGVRLVAVSAPAYGASPVEHVSSIAEAAEALGQLGPDDAVLVKGSRVAGLERLADLLAGR